MTKLAWDNRFVGFILTVRTGCFRYFSSCKTIWVRQPTLTDVAEAWLTCVFRASWSGTARCCPCRWMVRKGLCGSGCSCVTEIVRSVRLASPGLTVWLLLIFGSHTYRTYCNTEEEHEHRHLTQIQAIKLFMTGRRPNLKCKTSGPPWGVESCVFFLILESSE